MNYFREVSKIRESYTSGLDVIAHRIVLAAKTNRQVFVMGNGGSCSIACHFVTDLSFVKHNLQEVKLKFFSLCTNLPMITAISNDCGYEKVFLNQLERKAEAGDLCIMISSSGNSKNLISAYEYCAQNSISVILILGFDGGTLKKLAKESELILHFNSEIGHYGPVEDVHQSVCHEIASLVKQKLGINA